MEHKKRILIINGNPQVTMLLKSHLQRDNQYEVTAAFSAQEGWEEIRNEKPNLVILDVILPGMSGYEFCTRLKFEQSDHIPVMMLTSRVRGQDVMQGYSGADCYLPKPYCLDRLESEIERLLGVYAAG